MAKSLKDKVTEAVATARRDWKGDPENGVTPSRPAFVLDKVLDALDAAVAAEPDGSAPPVQP